MCCFVFHPIKKKVSLKAAGHSEEMCARPRTKLSKKQKKPKQKQEKNKPWQRMLGCAICNLCAYVLEALHVVYNLACG